jgi:hypothetical protein
MSKEKEIKGINEAVGTLKLGKSIKIDDKEVTEINYDLDNLMVNSIEIAIKELALAGHVVTFQESDSMLHAALFAQAAGLTLNDLRSQMTLKDYLKAGVIVRNFLFLGLEDSSVEN